MIQIIASLLALTLGLSGGYVSKKLGSGGEVTETISTGASVAIGASLTGGTANRVLYENSSNLLTESANLTFNGTNVGIGSAAPATPLEVVGKSRSSRSGASAQYVELDGGDSGSTYLIAAGSNKPLTIQNSNIGTSAYIALQTESAEKVRITNTGLVGIGTTTPSQLLAVHGNALFSGNITSVANITATGTLRFTNSTATSSIAGVLGIGTTTPNWALQIATTSNNSRIQLALTDPNAGTDLKHWTLSSQGGNFYIATSSDALATSSIPAFMIDSNGNIGIGIATPDADQVHIQSGSAGTLTTATSYDELVVEGSDSTGITINSPDALAGGLAFGSPSDSLTAAITMTLNSNAMVVGTLDSGSSLIFRSDNDVEAMRIDSSQRVGIGTTTPVSKLEISDTLANVPTIRIGTNDDVVVLRDSVVGQLVFTAEDDSSAVREKTGLIKSIAEGCDSGGTCRWDGTLANNKAGLGFFTLSSSAINAEAMRITNDGRIGIGTTTPNWTLQISTSTSNRIQLALTDPYAGANLKHWTMSSQGGNFYIATSSDASYPNTAATSSIPAFMIDRDGNVGIGTTTTQGAASPRLVIEGRCSDTGSGCADYAESYPSTEPVESGDILTFDQNQAGQVRKAGPEDNVLIGVVSSNPAIIIEGNSLQLMTGVNYKSNPNKPAVALAGRIPVKINLEGGEIKIGDPLTISSVSGVAKKITEPGPIIGYALENYTTNDQQLTTDDNKIMMFVTNTRWEASPSITDIPGVAQILDIVKQWLESMKVFIEDGLVRLKNLVAEKITTQTLCVEDVCVDKAGLQSLLLNVGTTSPAFLLSLSSTATTTIHLGTAQSTTNGSCIQMYSSNGTAVRLYITPGTNVLVTEAGSCNSN